MSRVLRSLCLTLGLLTAIFARAADVNTATAFQLEAIRGIGEQMAQDIVQNRQQSGTFKNWDDFKQRISGVGDKNLKVMQSDGLTLLGAQ